MFISCQVLILLPLRSTALRVVSRLLELAQKETRTDSIQNKQRFLEEFGDADSEEADGAGAAAAAGAAKSGTGAVSGSAGLGAAAAGKSRTGGGRPAGGPPAEHAALFEGNSDDHFRLGIKITRSAPLFLPLLIVGYPQRANLICLIRTSPCLPGQQKKEVRAWQPTCCACSPIILCKLPAADPRCICTPAGVP
jgi:hypothetical protein